MSSPQQQSHDSDLESVICDGVSRESGGRQASAVNEGRGPLSSDSKENARFPENIKDNDNRRASNVSECSVEIVDLESGALETKLHLGKTGRDCRICHLSIDATDPDSGVPMELGCCCKDDLAAAHKQCAEAWFKIKGNKTCEICGSIAQNVAVANETELTEEQWNETNDAAPTATAPIPISESRNFWQGHRFLNFLLACMVFAFVISWLFHFNIHA